MPSFTFIDLLFFSDSTSYVDPGFVGGLLLNVTFWPGWFGTGALAISGLLRLLGRV